MTPFLFTSLFVSHSLRPQVSLLPAQVALLSAKEVWTLMPQSFIVSSQNMKFLVCLNERQQVSIQKCNLLGWFCCLKPILINPRKHLEDTIMGPISFCLRKSHKLWWVWQVVTMVTNQRTVLLGECSREIDISVLFEEEEQDKSNYNDKFLLQ